MIEVTGPSSKCPECLMDYFFGYFKCSGCGNEYEGWGPKRYIFVGKDNFKIPQYSLVFCLKWGKRRHVLVEYKGEKIRTMGTLLRKIKEDKK